MGRPACVELGSQCILTGTLTLLSNAHKYVLPVVLPAKASVPYVVDSPLKSFTRTFGDPRLPANFTNVVETAVILLQTSRRDPHHTPKFMSTPPIIRHADGSVSTGIGLYEE